MKTREEIIQYLGIEDGYDYVDEMISAAMKVEERFADEIAKGTIGYCMIGDFNRMEDGIVHINTIYENGVECLDVYAIPNKR